MNRLLGVLRAALSVLLTMGTVIFVSSLFSFQRDYFRAFGLSLVVILALFGLLLLGRKFGWRALLALPVLLPALWYFGLFSKLYELGGYYAGFIYRYDLMRPVPTELGQSITLTLAALASGLLCVCFALRRVNAGALLVCYLTMAILPFPIAEPVQYTAALRLIFLSLIMLCVLRAHSAVCIKYKAEVSPRPYLTAGIPMCVLIVALAAILPHSDTAYLKDFPAALADWWAGGGGIFRINGGSGGAGVVHLSNGDEVELGGPNDNRETLLFSVRTSDPRYMYSAVYDNYTGSSWESSSRGESPSENLAEQLLTPDDPGLPWFDTAPRSFSIVYNNLSTDVLLLPRFVSAVSLREGGPLRADRNGIFKLRSSQSADFAYQAWARRLNYAKAREHLMDTPVPPERAVRPIITERTLDLARRLFGELPPENQNPFDYVKAVESYLSSSGEFTYDLNPPEAPGGADFVDYFLFESKTGYCTSFASAMAVMLQAMGFDARYCSGFIINPQRVTNGVYRVTAKEAHAWVEVAFPVVGRLEFDPTATALSEGYRERQRPDDATRTGISPSARPSSSPSPTPTASPGAPSKSFPWFVLPSALLLVWLLILLRAALIKYQARKTKTWPPSRRVSFWFGKIRQLLKLEGLTMRANESLDEFLARAQATLPASASELPPLFELAERAAYSRGGLPDDADTAFIEPLYYQMASDITANYSDLRKNCEVYITGRIIKYDRKRD
ncbi:hypothetical protein FACS18949_05770 [Clostridia bacterium]|nr:hypothetical protein FACS18949_05770 [Clostridia bacterium]